MGDSNDHGEGHSRWLLHEIGSGTATHCVVASARFPGRPDSSALRSVLHMLTDRHAAFRIIFPPAAEPAKLSVPLAQLCFPEADASDLDDEQLASWLEHAAREPFDLARGPRLRIHVCRTSAEDFIILVVGHHFIVDIWSMTTLVREIETLYVEQARQTLPALAGSTAGDEEPVRLYRWVGGTRTSVHAAQSRNPVSRLAAGRRRLGVAASIPGTATPP
jgi:hypothetical protein